MNNTDLDDLATRAGFAVNMLGEIVTPAPTEDARKPLRMFAELLLAAERAARQEALTEERIWDIGRKWAKEDGWADFERNDFVACVRECLAATGGRA